MNRYVNILLALALTAGPRLAFAAGAGHGEESSGGGIFEVLGLQWRGIVVQISGFILLFLLLRKFLFGPIQGALAMRRDDIQGAYDRAEQQQREVDRRREEVDQRLSGMEAERRELLAQAGREAKALQDQILQEARTERERLLEEGRRLMENEQEKARVVLRQETADLAMRAAGQLIEETMNEDRHRRLVSDFIARVES